jgi:gas vesicle protein
MSDSGHRGAFVFGLILGAAGGALGALLMTPKSGQEIREQIKGQTGPVQERLSTATSGMRERADDVIGASKDKVTQMAQRGQYATDQVVDTSKPNAAQATPPEPHAPPRASDTAPATKPVEHPGETSPGTE